MAPPHDPEPSSLAAAAPAFRRLLVRLAFAFIIFSAVFSYLFNVRLDPYKCRSILHEGSWTSTNSQRPFSRWSPYNTKLREYSRDDISSCLANRRVVFAGDSWTRQLYWAAAARLDRFEQGVATLDFYLSDYKQVDLTFEAAGVRLEFIWDPWLNSTGTKDQLERFQPFTDPSKVAGLESIRKDSPGLLVVGSPGLFAARHGGESYEALFRKGVDSVLPLLTDDLDTVLMSRLSLRSPSTDSLPNQLFLLPVPTPRYKRLTPPRRKTITPEKIQSMNAYLRTQSGAAQSYIPWVFNAMLENEGVFKEDGLHVLQDARDKLIDVILNERCNAGLKKELDRAGSLGCISYRAPNLVQIAILIVSALAYPLFLFTGQDDKKSAGPVSLMSSAAARPLALLALVPGLCYLAERTHTFLKTDREWDGAAFIVFLVAFAVVAARSISPLVRRGETTPLTVLPREHSTEWKGWMQIIILMLNYYDGTSPLFHYRIYRLLIATYVFLSVYGHTTYFLSTNDYSLRRVATVLLRLNLLNCLLTYTLAGSWTAYYFTPLISIWFLTAYATLGLRRSANDNFLFLVGKIVVVALVVNLIVFNTNTIERICRAVNVPFRSSWDGRRLHTKLEEDRLMPFIAMLAAAIVHRVYYLRSRDSFLAARPSGILGSVGAKLDALLLMLSTWEFPRMPVLGGHRFITVAATAVFTILGVIMTTNAAIAYHDTYNVLHPWLSWLPILAGVYLRSALLALRGSYLTLPVSIGEMALETYVLHHHVWLAGRGTGVLGLWARPREGLILGWVMYAVQRLFFTIVFFWVAGKARDGTRVAVELIMGQGSAPEGRQGKDDLLDADLLESKGAKAKSFKASGRGDVRIRVLGVVGLLWAASLLYGL